VGRELELAVLELGGGEAGHTSSDPFDPNLVYATEYGGFVSRYDHRTRPALGVSVYPYNPSGHAAADRRTTPADSSQASTTTAGPPLRRGSTENEIQ